MSEPRIHSPTHDFDTDAEIARLLRAGPAEQGLALAWRRFAGRVRGWLLSFGCPPPVVDDATQEVFARMYAERERLVGNNVGGWVFTLTRYEALTRTRGAARERRQRVLAHRHWVPPDVSLADEAAAYARLLRNLDAFRAGLGPEDAFVYDCLGGEEPERSVEARYVARFGSSPGLQVLRSRRWRMRNQIHRVLRGKEPKDEGA